MQYPNPRYDILQLLRSGTVIPAHPLALLPDGTLDQMRQKRLTRYYISSGAGGVAVGVHTTQFEIRQSGVDLLRPVLQAAAEEIDAVIPGKPFIKVAGIVGPVKQAVEEAKLAVDLGYHLGLVSMGGLADLTEAELIDRLDAIAKVIPVFGFYLQPAVGGRVLSYEFWKEAAGISNLHAVKVAAFNRYQTLDVVRAICHSHRHAEIALYTGNDDNIIGDLITPYLFVVDGKPVEKRFVGGLLGHWAVWTNIAVNMLKELKKTLERNADLTGWLALAVKVTDMNAAVFDAAHQFKGCIPGIHEVLRRQGLLAGTWCLNPNETLSPGQAAEISRIYQDYRELTDDEFVRSFLAKQFEERKKLN